MRKSNEGKNHYKEGIIQQIAEGLCVILQSMIVLCPVDSTISSFQKIKENLKELI